MSSKYAPYFSEILAKLKETIDLAECLAQHTILVYSTNSVFDACIRVSLVTSYKVNHMTWPYFRPIWKINCACLQETIETGTLFFL